jgi:hypothetical protein
MFIGSCLILSLLCGCSSIRSAPKYAFSNGYYKAKVFSPGPATVYVNNEEDFVLVYPVTKKGNLTMIDTSLHAPLALPQQFTETSGKAYVFHIHSFDIDFLTIPFKYRPKVGELPRQFNAHLSGGLYLGYRNDSYVIKYQRDPMGRSSRRTTHFGFSVGGFSGIGGAAMNPWVTNDAIAIEYDGLIWTKGVASIIGLDQITLGLALGWDHLLDNNKRVWRYQGKPWVGLVFGLNLN